MKRYDVFPSKYLKATDLNGKALCVTIERAPLVILKNPEGKEQSKTVLHFVKAKKDASAKSCELGFSGGHLRRRYRGLDR